MRLRKPSNDSPSTEVGPLQSRHLHSSDVEGKEQQTDIDFNKSVVEAER